MSEKTLDNVLRHLRIANTYIQTAEDISDKVLKNHIVAADINRLKRKAKDTIEFLDQEYRESHYQRRRGRK